MPRPERNAKTHNIFLLSKEKVQKKYFNNQETAVSDIINRLMDEAAVYEEQELIEGTCTETHTVRLFFHKEEYGGSKLASFCRPFVKADQDIITFRPRSASSVMFIWSASHIFAVTTGQGYRVVNEFYTPKFGMLVVSTFQQLFHITALDSNGMSSIVHSSKTIYANEIDFIDVDALDTVFKEVTGRLNDRKKVHELLRLNQNSKKKSMKITAKDSIQFSNALNFEGLLHILIKMDQYDFSALQDSFNLISPVTPKQNATTIVENDAKVIEKMFTAIIADSSLGFDLFNRSTNDFIEADEYALTVDGAEKLASTEDIEPSEFIKEGYLAYLGGAEPTIETFSDFVKSVNIIASKGDDIVSNEKLLKHISGEIEVNGKNYYVFYGDYYYLSDTYSSRLNQSLNGKLQPSRFIQLLKTEWKAGDKEDNFNENASNAEGYIHLHKIKPELIEFADLLKVDDSGVTIVHVKDGFDDDMRALDRQVELSITRVMDLRNNNNDEYMRKLYQNAAQSRKGRNITVDFNSANDFIKAMKESELHYVIAIRPPQKDLLTNRSNIAKHCLNALILRCFNQGVDLKIDIL